MTPAQMLRQGFAEFRKKRRKRAIGLLHSRMNGTSFWNCCIDEFAGPRVDQPVPRTTAAALVCTHPAKHCQCDPSESSATAPGGSEVRIRAFSSAWMGARPCE